MSYYDRNANHIFYTVKFDRISSDESLFDQLTRQVKETTRCFRKDEASGAPFKTEFKGELSYDAGGPFRDVLEQICAEIIERFLKPTANMIALADTIGYEPQQIKSATDEQHLLFIGKMIGWVIQSYSFNLSLDMNILFWKQLLGCPITIEDLKHNDVYRYEYVQAVKRLEYPSTFVADLGSGEEIELVEGGSLLDVTAENAHKFEQAYLAKYLELDARAY